MTAAIPTPPRPYTITRDVGPGLRMSSIAPAPVWTPHPNDAISTKFDPGATTTALRRAVTA
ncbi:hypothetical protein [Rhodococcus sp. 06-221-2]|uniref:hypothetical protein n=1 Tax=Rhodococcus sp. 06-221-2 TaxID=2022514 RepID=UPI00211AA706|nr:hypothetical protein [Rhodococcus sp. 06-221-2]